MSALVKGVALFVAVTCVVWIAVLWRWSATARDMNTQDIVVYLGLLPLAVFALAVLLRWAWQSAVQRQAAAAATAAAQATANASGSTPGGSADTAEAAERHATVQLLAAHLVCAAGSSPAELVSAAKDGKPRPALDAELRDDEGLPVFTARIADLDLAALEPLLEAHLGALRTRQAESAEWAEWNEKGPSEHTLRALAALREPLGRAVDALLPWAARFEPKKLTDNARGKPDTTAPGRRIRVLLNWPADWTPFEQALADAVAAECLGTRDGALPAACFVITSHTGSGEELLLHADRLLQTLARDGHDEPVIVAACHSAISEDAIAALERSSSLFHAQRRPNGRMAGEAAAVLVLANASWPAAADAAALDAPPQHLHRPALLRRDKSVEAAGRVGSDIVQQAITQALLAARVEAATVTALACDADQHTARSAELHVGAQTRLPQLDAPEDLRVIGTVTGAVGAASALLVIACAAECAKASDTPCLAVTVGDPFARLALLVLPKVPLPDNVPTAA